jgi:spermidine/putrescine transport system permease protein
MNFDESSDLPYKLLLGLVVTFFYVPIIFVVLVSFNQGTLSILPYEFTLDHYAGLFIEGRYNEAILNSVVIGLGSGVLSMILGAAAAWSVTRYEFRGRYLAMVLFVLPLIVPTLITAVSGSLILSEIYQMPQSVTSAILLQTVHGMSFSFLIMLTQLSQYPTELDEAAKTYGASTIARFREVTLPLIWPGLFGAFLLPFLIAFNYFELTFYTVGATSTLPTTTWGQLRHGIRPSLFALSTLIVVITLGALIIVHFLGRHLFTNRPTE